MCLKSPAAINGPPVARPFWLLGCCLVWMLATLGEAAAHPTLILVSIDGYRADYLQRGDSPVLAGLASEGVRSRGLRPVFPSLTYPNHYTMVTGLLPDQHGIVNNSMHDPVLGDFSPSLRAANEDGRWWDAAEPIWVTAQKQGRTTATMFWPGSQAEIRGVRPKYWRAYEPGIPPQERVEQVLAWLDLPAPQRPQFICLYFEQVDTAGHNFGPDSVQVNQALLTVDAALGRLVQGLHSRLLYDKTNLVIVSDHGMLATSPDRIVLLDKLVDTAHLRLVSSLVVTGIDPLPGHDAEVAAALLVPHEHLSCWKKAELPQRLHYGHNPRVPAIVCISEPGWMLSTAAAETKRDHPVLGAHGYESDQLDMLALFVAEGPAFRHHLLVPQFDNVNVYPLLAKLLELPKVTTAGSIDAVAAMLAP